MKVIKNCAEFGIELVLSVPYAYWLHERGQLQKVITSKGMKPFYYFCEDVDESFLQRTIDNKAAGLFDLPNNWTHHNALALTGKDYSELTEEEQSKVNGVLDYSKWKLPPYKEHFKNQEFNFGKTIMILNKYNIEHGHKPFGFFDFECLVEMFNYLTDKGYTIIYKRPTNQEKGVTIDNNEIGSVQNNLDLKADVEGVGVINDHELTKYFKNVILFDDIVKQNKHYSYNEVQLKVMANVDGFISQCGGNTILACCWGVPVLCYVTQGKEFRPNYFSNDSYWYKLSDAKVTPIFDFMVNVPGNDEKNNFGHKLNKTGKNDYSELLIKMKEEF